MEFKRRFFLKSIISVSEILLSFLLKSIFWIYVTENLSVSKFYIRFHIENKVHAVDANRKKKKKLCNRKNVHLINSVASVSISCHYI